MQIGDGTVKLISWPSDLSTYFTGLTLRYFDTNLGQNVNVNMLTTTSANFTDTDDPATLNIYSAGLVQPVVPPSVPTLVSPANGVTGQPTSVTLRWNVASNALTYHAQLSTDSNFTTFQINDSTLADTSRVASGLAFGTKYYWRVRAKNGALASAFSTRFDFTTQFQPPPAPTLVSPPNGSVSLPVNDTLRWNSVTGANSYRVQLSTSPTFTSGIIVDDSLAVTFRPVNGLQNNTQYYWRVYAINVAGPGPYSTVFNFTTIVTIPAAPVLVSPPNGQTGVSLLPTLTWNSVPTAATYRLQVALDTAFTQIAFDDSTITSTSRQIGPLVSSTTYYWRARAKNVAGTGPYSARFSFETTAAPPVPQLLLPPDSATRVSNTPAFSWARIIGATSYHLQVGTDMTFSTLLVNDSTIVDTARTVGALPFGSRLMWRVRARNSSGYSEFSTPRVFTVMLQPPGTPFFIFPTNNYQSQTATLTLRWTTVMLASGYHLQVALDTLMTNILVDDSTLVDTSKAVSLAPNTANYWRVRAHNIENSYGPWTYVRRFSVLNVPPAVPTPISPANGEINVLRLARLQWLGTPGAQSYRVQVALDSLFTQIVNDDSNLAVTEATTGLLLPFTRYYWHVRAKGTGGSSQYSALRFFTTGMSTPVAEETVSPLPSSFTLHQNYPNPFNPTTTIPFDVSQNAFVTIRVYDLLGREMQTLVNEHLPAGAYTVRWNAQNAQGESVPSGIYFVRMTATPGQTSNSIVAVQKMLLLK